MSTDGGRPAAADQGTSVGVFYLLAAVAALLSTAIRIYLKGSGPLQYLGYAVDLALLVLIVWTAVRIARGGGHAPLRSSLVGAVYGAVWGLGYILMPPTVATIRAAVVKELAGRPHVSQAVLQEAIARVTTPTAHVLEAVESIIIYWLVALLVGWIASLFVKKPGQSSSV